jgi:glycosyltransferase involved in cell wall biosynthesis
MAVYNSARFLDQAITSILSQDFGDFTLFISDDGSSDDSVAICEEFAQRDQRICFTRQPRNLGAIGNLNLVAQAAQAEYFMWVGPDDYWDPDLLTVLLALMADDPGLVVATSGIERVDSAGQRLYVYNCEHPDTSRMSSPIQRVRAVFRHAAPATTESLIRVSALRNTGYYRFGIIPADMVLLGELSVQGGIKGVRELLFHKRDGGQNVLLTDSHFYQGRSLHRALESIDLLELSTMTQWQMKYEYIRMMCKHRAAGVRDKLKSMGSRTGRPSLSGRHP